MLDAWAASPARFREDANAEDDLALGGYRHRVVVELVQNAADAGDTCRLSYDGGVLSAVNTGLPLTAEGVAALASLRASAKRGGRTVGRFGVGFASVAAVADEVVVASTDGAVRFSRARTLEAVAALPSLAGELAARGGRVPLLRLPFADPAVPAAGWTTEVLVTVTDGALVQRLLDEVDPTLLLVLPGLVTLTVGSRQLSARVDGDDVVVDGVRWRVARASGPVAPALLANRPVEERAQDTWHVTWAAAVSDDGEVLDPPGARVVRAPTPTDDPLSLPVVLAASLPLGPDRRRVQSGPLATAVLRHAADTLPGLVARLADTPSRLRLVPGPLGAGEVDAELCSLVLAALQGAVVRHSASVLDGASPTLLTVLDDVLDLLAAPWSASRWAAPLRALGVPRLDLAGLCALLAGVDRDPSWWRRLYDALPPDRDQLGALPVPLADGSLAPSPRGLLLSSLPVDLSPLGLRVVHPDAAHPLLSRLGALDAEPRAVLEDPRVRAAVEAAGDVLEDPLVDGLDRERGAGPLADAVLALVGGAGLAAGDLPWLAALPLPADDGTWRPAGELLVPGGPLAQVVDLSAGFGLAAPVAHEDVLAAVGVGRGFAVVPALAADGVDGLEDWLDSLPPGEEPSPVVRDLDLVRPDAWPQALDLLRREDLLRLSYVSWWLASHPVLSGQRPADLRAPGSDPLLAGLYDDAPAPDPVLAGPYDDAPAPLPGVRTALSEVLADDPAGLLARLADPARSVGRDQLRAVHAALALADPDVDPPQSVRAVLAGEVVVLPAEDCVVVDRPDLLARLAPYAVVPVPLHLAGALADVLDVALATEVVPDADLPGSGVVVQDALRVPTAGGALVDVTWAAVGGADHVVGVAGRARAEAWRAGDWASRHTREARLRGADPAESDLDPT